MMEGKLLIGTPSSLRRLFLSIAHDKADHQGSNCMLSAVTDSLLGQHGKGYNTLLLTYVTALNMPAQPTPL